MKTTSLLLLAILISLNATFAQENTEKTQRFPPIEDRYLGQKPPGLTPEIFAPGIVSTEAYYENYGLFTPDMKEFYFGREGGKYGRFTPLVIKYENQRWGSESVVPTSINKIINPSLSAKVSEIKSFGSPFNDIRIMSISVSSKGTYYFDEQETYGILRYSRLIDGKREKPQEMRKEINTGKWTAHPFVAPDESYLIWDSEREDGNGSNDIYISFRQQDGSWGPAINMGDQINTGLMETGGHVTPDGKYLFFLRGEEKAKEDGSRIGNIHWVDAQIIETLRPKSTSSTTNLIKKVETGLTTRVHIEGDSTWSIEERMEHYGIPGVSIAVINNGKIAWAKGYGVMDKESNVPVTKQTLFQAALLSMPVTAYGALRLVEQNKVSLDEDINSILKSWKLPENEFTKDKKATIKNLLNHSAGINLHGTPGYSRDLAIPTLVETLNGTSPATNDPILVNKEPDESIYISSSGYGIIQQMMIDIEGKTFPKIMNELVLQPLEMSNSTFNQTLSTEQLNKAATGYLDDGSMVKGKSHSYPVMAAKGLWSTAEDIAKFIINIQQTLKGNSNKGLSKDMTELMVTPYGVSSYGPWFQYGLGIQSFNKKDDVYLRHWGWNRGFYAEIMAHKDKDYGVVVLTNSTFPEFNAEVIRAVALAYKWDNYVPVYNKMAIEQSLVDEITGRYQSNDRIVEVFQKDNLLFTKNILDAKAEELIKVTDSTFARRNASRLIQFKPDSENETINLLYINSNDGAIVTSLAKSDNYKKSPVEFLLEGDFEKALKAYRTLKEQNPTHPTVTEDYLNDLGYRFFHEDRMKLSQNTFKINMILYPNSFKVYDSYAEACKKTGEIDLAILNYSKSLELNPQNNRSKAILKELQKGE